jgi:hypothetical protein
MESKILEDFQKRFYIFLELKWIYYDFLKIKYLFGNQNTFLPYTNRATTKDPGRICCGSQQSRRRCGVLETRQPHEIPRGGCGKVHVWPNMWRKSPLGA